MKQIKLTRGKYTSVDNWNYEWLNQWEWYCSDTMYAVRNASIVGGKQRRRIYMHREIMKTPYNMQTDHINNNTLDNQKLNLRIVTKSQNNINRKGDKNTSSRYKGVGWDNKRKRWRAKIKDTHIGYFTCEDDAGHAYDKEAREFYGKFAYLNFEE